MKPLRNFIPDTVDSVYPDGITRLYNNLWGSYSNTHMRRLPGLNQMWEITGHAIQYTGFMCSLFLCNSVPQSKLIYLRKSFDNILKENQLSAWFDQDATGTPIIKVAPHDPNIPECHPGLIIPEGTEIDCNTNMECPVCPCTDDF